MQERQLMVAAIAYRAAVTACAAELTDSSPTVEAARAVLIDATSDYAAAAGLRYVDALRAVRAAAGYGAAPVTPATYADGADRIGR